MVVIEPSLLAMLSVPAQVIDMSIAWPLICKVTKAGGVLAASPVIPNPADIRCAASTDASRVGWSHLMLTPTMGGTIAGSKTFFTIMCAQCIRYARSGGLYVAAMLRWAPVA